MADGGSRRVRTVLVEYSFDRLQLSKLQQAYELLVPDYVRSTQRPARLTGDHDEGGSDLREGVIGQTKKARLQARLRLCAHLRRNKASALRMSG